MQSGFKTNVVLVLLLIGLICVVSSSGPAKKDKWQQAKDMIGRMPHKVKEVFDRVHRNAVQRNPEIAQEIHKKFAQKLNDFRTTTDQAESSLKAKKFSKSDVKALADKLRRVIYNAKAEIQNYAHEGRFQMSMEDIETTFQPLLDMIATNEAELNKLFEK